MLQRWSLSGIVHEAKKNENRPIVQGFENSATLRGMTRFQEASGNFSFHKCLLLLVLVGALSCRENQKEEPPTKKPSRVALYSAVELTAEQLRDETALRCRLAKKLGQPVLLEFSAPWCEDCLRLQEMKKAPALSNALSSLQAVTVNVGDFDRHAKLIEAFGVKAIARWELLKPTDCDSPPWKWGRLGSRTLEPETGQPVGPTQLAEWVSRFARQK